MNQEEFARRTQAMRQTLYRTAYLYLGREADALEAVDEAVYQACGPWDSCGRRPFSRRG